MIYIINILTNTREGDAYDMVAINKYPIIYKTSREPVEFIYDDCMKEQLKAVIRNKITQEHAVLYIRQLNEDMSFKDYEYPVKNILENVKEEK